MQHVAFFDIDGTVFRSSLLVELVEGLIAEGIFPASARDGYARAYTAWSNREGSYEAYIDDLITVYLTHIRGVFYGDFADVGRRVVAEQSKRVYRYTRDLITDLKSKDYYIVAISQSPKTLLDEFCASYGFDKVYGRMYELGPQDRFTGEIVNRALIEDKAAIAERVFAQAGIERSGAIAVGDTEGDIALLECVDTPICFNPNQKLYQHALSRAWPIVVERKDVVYTIAE